MLSYPSFNKTTTKVFFTLNYIIFQPKCVYIIYTDNWVYYQYITSSTCWAGLRLKIYIIYNQAPDLLLYFTAITKSVSIFFSYWLLIYNTLCVCIVGLYHSAMHKMCGTHNVTSCHNPLYYKYPSCNESGNHMFIYAVMHICVILIKYCALVNSCNY